MLQALLLGALPVKRISAFLVPQAVLLVALLVKTIVFVFLRVAFQVKRISPCYFLLLLALPVEA